jgi:hypothetical protein
MKFLEFKMKKWKIKIKLKKNENSEVKTNIYNRTLDFYVFNLNELRSIPLFFLQNFFFISILFFRSYKLFLLQDSKYASTILCVSFTLG